MTPNHDRKANADLWQKRCDAARAALAEALPSFSAPNRSVLRNVPDPSPLRFALRRSSLELVIEHQEGAGCHHHHLKERPHTHTDTTFAGTFLVVPTRCQRCCNLSHTRHCHRNQAEKCRWAQMRGLTPNCMPLRVLRASSSACSTNRKCSCVRSRVRDVNIV